MKHKATRRGKTLAQRADKYVCYQNSVQEPEVDVPFVERVFRKHRGRPPRRLREDFCGTAAFACAWVQRHRNNVAFGIDLDAEPLDWGRRHNLTALSPEQQSRVKLIEGNVLHVGHERVDVTVAYNFSYSLFRTRPEMLEYFRAARASLDSGGLFFLDVYGGPEAQETKIEKRKCEGFTYIWEQHRFDPIQNHGVNYIHYAFPDGSELRRAFAYEWRIWSVPELREILLDAGFSKTEVYWEGTDRQTGKANDVFTRRERASDDPAWVAYIVAIP
ncbi:MAG: class I SAM-dependent methyltransferase [Myxococcales bacterium]|nr:class I SAM-dependent methyltransferase [Myxococcales bacterium]